MKLKLGLPKGSLQDATFKLFAQAGWTVRVDSRSYHPVIDDPELEPILMRPQEIPRYLEDGVIDAGLTGWDWIKDNGADVVEVCELTYSKATRNPMRIVLAVAGDSEIQSVKDLEGKRLATEYVRLTTKWLEENGVTAHVEFSWGADEMKVPQLVDAIVVNTETGSSLKAHKLRIVGDPIIISTTRFVANKTAWADPEKRAKIEAMGMLLTGALNAGALVGLKLNVAKEDFESVIAQLPALKKPTVSPLWGNEGFAIEIIIEEHQARDLIPRLKRAGASGLVEYPLNKVVY
ncbi:ATP phosphoribosyltransferase [Armatimonas rosea]|uniref:ATP phosphoribosyltransferase n=1 Tax=Armatimonas rosea TaxID=685828 RepID=A0A7W9SR29_ARMRO|nr:ATP phosphoribosyltransferase [Armatimonas rosea]MBB6050649.1 ATP phosphoribosyltransferase [Armatimonas rosea]